MVKGREAAAGAAAVFNAESDVNGDFLDAHFMHNVCTERMHKSVHGPKG
jgi:hypothetical protein